MNDDNNFNQLNNNVDDVFNSQPDTNEIVQPTMNIETTSIDDIQSMNIDATPLKGVQQEVNPVQEAVAPVDNIQSMNIDSTPLEGVQQEVNPVQETVAPVDNIQSMDIDATPLEGVQPEVSPVQETVAPVDNNQAVMNTVNMNGNNQESVTVSKKSNNTLKVVLIIVGIIALLAVGFFVVTNLFLVNNKNVVNKSITKAYDYLLASVDKIEKETLVIDPSKDVFGISGNVSFSSNYRDDKVDLTKLSKYKINYNGAYDLANKKISLGASLNKDANELLEFKAYLEDKLLTFGSETLSQYSYQMNLPESFDYEFKQSVNYSDIKTLINIAKEVTLNNVDEKDIVKEDAERKVGNENKKYQKITYTIDINDLSKKIAEAYKNSDTALDVLSRLTSSSKDQIKSSLEDFINESSEKSELNVVVYVEGLLGDFAGLSIYNSDNPDKSFELDKINGNYQFYINGIDNGSFKGNYMSDSKTFNIYFTNDNDVLELSIKEVSDGKYSLSFNLQYEESKIAFDATVENIVSSTQQTINIDAKVSAIYDNVNIEFGLSNQTAVTKNVVIENNTSEFTKDYYEMTYEELYEIENKLSQVMYSVLYDFMNGYAPYSVDDNSMNSNYNAIDNYSIENVYDSMYNYPSFESGM